MKNIFLKIVCISIVLSFLLLVDASFVNKRNFASGASNSDCKIELQFKVGDKSYTKNNKTQPAMDAMPEMKSNRMFLMIRYVAEAVGAKVEWIAATKMVKITRRDGQVIEMVVGSGKAKINGVASQIDMNNLSVVPYISQGRTYCPLRFVATSLGATGENDIIWDQQNKSATLFFDDPDCTSDEEVVPPSNFVLVPANSKLGINEPFYVSKYYMKIKDKSDGNQKYDSSFVAESRASGTPWIGLTMEQAKAECEALGEGYSLISNSEWLTIAHDMEKVAKNWSDNSAHETGQSSAKLNIGHVCRYGPRGIGGRVDAGKNNGVYNGESLLEASTDDNNGCYGYKAIDADKWGKVAKPELNKNGWNLYRRTFYLTNGSVLWDFGGNVWSWTDFFVPKAKDRAHIDGHIDECYLEINACNTFSDKMKAVDIQSLNPAITDVTRYQGKNYYPKGEDKWGFVMDEYTNLNCLGRYHPTSNDDSAGLIMRGCSYMHGDGVAGIYSIGMGYNKNPSHIECEVGFRCVWRPTKQSR